MYAVNTLVTDAYNAIGMVGIGEESDGDYQKVGVLELNRLISHLNNQGFLAMSQKSVDHPRTNTVYFRKLEEGETADNTIDMEPPRKVEGVARKIGNRYTPLRPSNIQQMAGHVPTSMATSWTYNVEIEDGPTKPRNVGIVTLDGDPYQPLRIWYNSQIPRYTLDDVIYLPDLYDELLLSGLCWFMACYYELSEQKKADTKTDFDTACNLIKRSNITQRMLVNGATMGSWQDAYQGGLAGEGM